MVAAKWDNAANASLTRIAKEMAAAKWDNAEWQAMRTAAMEGDADTVEEFFNQEPAYWWYFRDETEASLLDIAVRFQHKELALLLLDGGADANFDDLSFLELTALYWATINNEANEVRRLLASGSNPNAQDARGDTCLHTASRMNSSTIILLLLEAGASVEIINAKKQTPLHVAAIRGSLQAAQLLLRSGAVINERDAKGNTPLDLAYEHKAIINVQTLEDNDDWDDKMSNCKDLIAFLSNSVLR